MTTKNANANYLRKQKLKQAVTGYLFIMPWLVGFTIFFAGPMFFSLFTSFTNYDITSQIDWVGLANYKKILFDDQYFWLSMKNTVYYATFAVPLGIIIGVVAAVLLNTEVPGVKIFRTIFFMPQILTGVSVLLLWLWIFNPQVGPINTFLRYIGIANPPMWFNDPNWSKPAMIIMSGWGAVGGMIVYLAGLQGIPKTIYEAAEIDGAGTLRQFWSMTLPLLSPTIFFKLVTGVNGAMQTWGNALVMTQGGPSNSTLFYGLYMYNKAFTEMRMGYASAMAWILLVIVLVLTGIQFWGAKKWVYYESGR